MVEELHEKVAFCYEVLASIERVSIPKPQGSFYLFPRIDGLDDSFSFALSLLKQHKVAVAPGIAFGNGGEGAVRISCATDRSILEPAMERFRRFVEAG